MHPLAITQMLILLTLANGVPVVAKLILRDRLSLPLDANRKFVDGKPIFGSAKTIRGILSAIAVTAASAPLLGLGVATGVLAGTAAMAGDLLSSFFKRRLGRAPSSRAIGIDQIPESLLPLLACRQTLALTAVDIVVACAAFFAGELLLSRLLFRLHLRERPY
jgi:CDP-diglyceride synthetase